LVITGGTSQLRGISALANSIFGMPVRLGAPNDVEGPAPVINNPIYSTSVGLLKYAYQLENFLDMEQMGEKNKQASGFGRKFKKFISRILKN
jgi:cell division protein FtsA